LAFLAFVSSAGATPARTLKIDASAAPWVVAGKQAVISGTVTPATPGFQLSLQRRAGTSWLSVANKTVAGGSAFSFSEPASNVGLAIYRVVTTKGASYVGASPSVRVRILHWMSFTGVPQFGDALPAPGDGDLTTASATTGGVTYDNAVSMDAGCYNQSNGNAWLDYMLDRKYEQLTATVGIADGGPAGLTASYSFIGGGRKLVTGTLVTGALQKIKVPLDGIYKLRLEINIPDPYHAAGCSADLEQVVFGDPQILGP
jgi:hypothetical protein